jgi:hypothetical protein
MIVTVSDLTASHASEVFVWSLFYAIVGAAPAGTDLGYFTYVNYTTLGHTSGALAAGRAAYGDERSTAVRLVNGRHFRCHASNDA